MNFSNFLSLKYIKKMYWVDKTLVEVKRWVYRLKNILPYYSFSWTHRIFWMQFLGDYYFLHQILGAIVMEILPPDNSISHRALGLNRKVNVDILLHILGTILITFWKWSGKRNLQFEKYSIWHNSNTVVCRVEETSDFFLCFLVTSVLLNFSELVFSLVKWKLFS